MPLKLRKPIAPMEALSVDAIPEGREWQYEPKWDGFRCVAFRDGSKVELQSKSGQPLTRYFPEVASAVRELKANTFVLDGEIAVPEGRRFSFDALLQRIHPAASRVKRLSTETPAIYIVFDCLAGPDGRSILEWPLKDRRALLERFAAETFDGRTVRLSPSTMKLTEARKWLARGGGVLDGIIAKRRDLAYATGSREAMQKIKNFRSADCVVGGFRYGTGKKVVGSLLLGLYDDAGLLNHVGFTSAIAAKERAEVTRKVEAERGGPGFTGRAPGGPSRWNGGKASEWQALRPALVVEVSYDHASEGRFRHGTRLLRWRPDKKPKQCKMEQLQQKRADLMGLLR